MRALVIGGNGFVGSHVVDNLLGRGLGVRVYDRSGEQFREMPKEVDFWQGEFGDVERLKKALQNVDIVFHMLSTSIPSTSNIDPVADIEGNLVGTIRLLEMMRDAGAKRIVFLSSGGTVYGVPKTDPIREDHPEQPISSYGIVKCAIEKYMFMEQQLHGLQPVILRASNPYGPRQGHTGLQGVISTMLWRIMDKEYIDIWGDGSVVRDYIYISDLAELCVICALTDVCGTFNAGSGKGISLLELIETVEVVTGASVRRRFGSSRAFDVPSIVLDTSAIMSVLGWQPSTSLEMGIEKTWQWIQKQAKK